MRNVLHTVLLVWISLSSLLAQNHTNKDHLFNQPDTLTWYDESRQRVIPVAIYHPDKEVKSGIQKLVIMNHGYNQNEGTPYLGYSFLAEFLAHHGYLIISIQHELAGDSLIPSTGIPQIVRRPFWDRGADNIYFVINKWKEQNKGIRYASITLIGHSIGGDMVALFPEKYHGIADKIITLDNRRMPLPRTKHPGIYSLRSCDLPADEGVLPNAEEQKKYGMKIIKLLHTKHNDMCDVATKTQQKEIQEYILKFLKD